jgi:transcriptional regulator with PAS, ATPase and Fis domain
VIQSTSLAGASPAISALREEIEYAARSDAKVLITGESGAGKEIVARLIHSGGRRRQAPLVTVNCAALTETLLETELFGHVRGSFTGAYRDKAGVFERANGGTVFMDEIGETTPRMQGLLLRFLETGEIQRVGSDDPRQAHVDVRVIAATNRVLVESVAAKTFREDLYYRLNVIHLQVPPLRQRREDVPVLLRYFLEAYSGHYRVECPELSPDALAMLTDYGWPGNVRELKNVVERLIVRNRTELIQPEDLPLEVVRKAAPTAQAPALTRAAVSVPDTLFDAMVTDRESFWSVVYAPFMSRDLTRDHLREVVRKGLERTSGNYKVMTELFNMPAQDYKRFLGFLRKYHCHMPFQQFRSAAGSRATDRSADADSDPAALSA